MDAIKFKEMVIKGVEANFAKDKELAPMLFLFDTTNGLGMMPIPANSDAQKDILVDTIIPAVIKQTNAQMIATVNEAWMRTQTPNTPVDHSIPVRDHKDKIEIIMMTIETRVNTEMVVWNIIRPDNKEPYIELNETANSAKGAQVKGRYANLLGQKPSKN